MIRHTSPIWIFSRERTMVEQHIVLHVGFLSKTYRHMKWMESYFINLHLREDFPTRLRVKLLVTPASSVYCGFLKSLRQELIRNSKKHHRPGSTWRLRYCICKKNKSTKVVAIFCCFWGNWLKSSTTWWNHHTWLSWNAQGAFLPSRFRDLWRSSIV